MYNDFCLRYRVGNYYCVKFCVSLIQSEGNIIECSGMCLRYRVRAYYFVQ